MIAISSVLGLAGVLVCIALAGVIGLVIHAEKQLRRSLAVLDFVLSLKEKAEEHIQAMIGSEVRTDDEGRRASAPGGRSYG